VDKLSELPDVEKELSNISGCWLSELSFDDNKYWEIDSYTPSRQVAVKNPIPSDYRFREDLIWLYRGNQDFAQRWKIRLEEQQRHERKLRIEREKRIKKDEKKK